jgi:hypothetical protein
MVWWREVPVGAVGAEVSFLMALTEKERAETSYTVILLLYIE